MQGALLCLKEGPYMPMPGAGIALRSQQALHFCANNAICNTPQLYTAQGTDCPRPNRCPWAAIQPARLPIHRVGGSLYLGTC